MSHVYWTSHFLQGTRKTLLCLTGNPVFLGSGVPNVVQAEVEPEEEDELHGECRQQHRQQPQQVGRSVTINIWCCTQCNKHQQHRQQPQQVGRSVTNNI